MRWLWVLWFSGWLWGQDNDVWIAHPFDANHFFVLDNGSYVDSGQVLGDSSSWSIGVGDLTGDGSLDVAVANDGACYVYENDGLGGFTRESIFGAGLPVGHSISLADMDQDGTLDMIMGTLVSAFSGENQIYLNDGTGTFTTASSLFGMANTRSLAVADLNGDGFPDVFEANQSSEANRVWFNDQTGQVTDSGQLLGASSSFSVALADLNSNATIDAVVANDGQPNVVSWNDGLGNFSLGPTLGGNDNTIAVALGDLDGNGSLDIVFGHDGAISSVPTQVYYNDGAGNFTLSSQVFPSPRTQSIQVTDLNRDGRNDILLGNNGNDAVWLNTGSGTFVATADTLSSGSSASVFAGFLRTNRGQARMDWGQDWTILDLLRFYRQLSAEDEALRGH